MVSVKLLIVNCQGLKRVEKDVFGYLRDKICNIYCVQDTNFTKDLENEARAQWGYGCNFSLFSSKSRRVCTLFNKNFYYKMLKEIKDNTVLETYDQNKILEMSNVGVKQ